MRIKNRDNILSICVIFALAAILLPNISSAKKRKAGIPMARFNTSIVMENEEENIKIGYPKEWSILDEKYAKSSNAIMGGIMFYYRHYSYDSKRTSKGWASVRIRWINTPGWLTDKWSLDEFFKDKDCGVLKCERENYGEYPSTYIDDSCKETTIFPRMQEGFCGYFIKKIPISGTTGYLFRNARETSPKDDQTIMQTYLLFEKGERIYYMEFSANKEEFSYFGEYFQVFISNFK